MPQPQYRVFHVDDEQPLLNLFKNFVAMQKIDWELTSFSDPVASISEIIDKAPDLVIIDLKMNRLNGGQLANIINKTCPFTKIVFLSSADQNEIDTMNLKNFSLIPKPIDTAAVEKIKEVLDRDIDVRIHPVVKNAIHYGMLNHLEEDAASVVPYIEKMDESRGMDANAIEQAKQLYSDFNPRDVLESNPLCLFDFAATSAAFSKQIYKSTIVIAELPDGIDPKEIYEQFPDILKIGLFSMELSEAWAYTYLLFNLKSKMLFIQGYPEKWGNRKSEQPRDLGRKFIPFENMMIAENNFSIQRAWTILNDYMGRKWEENRKSKLLLT